MTSPVPSVPAQRKTMYRGIDLEGFMAPFLERGLEISGLSSIMTSSLHSKNINLKIQAAWHDLRERFSIPRVGDKPQEVGSVLPLDQVRLPGEPVFGEPVPTEDRPVFGEPIPVMGSEQVPMEDLPTDEELAAGELQESYSREAAEEFDMMTEDAGNLPTDDELIADEFPELYNQESDEFYDPATDERTLDHTQTVMDEINQEDEIAFNPETPAPQEEPPTGPFPESGLYQNEWPGWQPTDEVQDFETVETPQGEIVGDAVDEFYGELPRTEETPNQENPALQDEYLPLDMEGDPASYVYDAETHDSKMFEIEETDPNETR